MDTETHGVEERSAITRPRAQELGKYLLGAAFVALCAQIVIPIKPVPFTMQTFAVFFLAAKLGAKGSVYALLLYLSAGIAGLPVFSRLGAGMEVLLAPTGGYLLGFVPAAYFTGSVLQRFTKKSFLTCLLAGLVGEGVLMLCGASRLAAFVGWPKAYALGVAPFLLTDLLKLTAFACVARERSPRKFLR
ncbi:MAG: biotin transporter BioY [Holosporales bacterium]|nr:biotin transporter BioY [Holosporales bacterium]